MPDNRGAPSVGRIVNGYEFTGGNHRDRANWRQTPYGPGANSDDSGNIVIRGPRGGVRIIQRQLNANGAAMPNVREYQATAAARAALMDHGETAYEQARAAGYDPGSFGNVIATKVEPLPLFGDVLSHAIRNTPSDQGRAAELTYTEGALRTTTGANAPAAEVRNASRMYFRQPGEPAAVDPQRQTLRRRFRDQAVQIAGPAYVPPAQNALAPQPNGLHVSGGVTETAGRRRRPSSGPAPQVSDDQLRQMFGH